MPSLHAHAIAWSRPVALIAGLLFLLVVSWGPAVAAVLCAPKSGEGPVRVRPATCPKAEVQLDPAALGLQGPPGSTGPQGPIGPAGPTALELADSAGTKVGDVVGVDTAIPETTIASFIGGVPIVLRATRLGFGSNSPPDYGDEAKSRIFFTTADCTGTGYIVPHYPGTVNDVLPWRRVVVREKQYAYVRQLAALESITFRSTWWVPASGVGEYCEFGYAAPGHSVSGVVPTDALDLFSLFTPPFTVRQPQ